MPKLSPKNKELVDKLYDKLNNDPLAFTVLNHFELEASESDEELDDVIKDVTLKDCINNLPDKDQSIVLYRESSIMYLMLDHLNLFKKVELKLLPSNSRSLNIIEAFSKDIKFTILIHYDTELWIFSKQDIDKLKVMIKDAILSKLLVNIASLKPEDIKSFKNLIISMLK